MFPQGGNDQAGICRLSWSSLGKSGVAHKGNGMCKVSEAGNGLVILKGLKGGPNNDREKVWGKGRRGGRSILDHGTDFCPYSRKRRKLRRIFRIKLVRGLPRGRIPHCCQTVVPQ